MIKVYPLYLLLFVLVGCGIKKKSFLQEKKIDKESHEIRKDSTVEHTQHTQTTLFSFENQNFLELEIISHADKDSIIIEKQTSLNSEKIIVRGGSLKLKAMQHTSDKIIKKDTLQLNKTNVQINTHQTTNTEQHIARDETQQRNTPAIIYFFIPFFIIFILLYIAWRIRKKLTL